MERKNILEYKLQYLRYLMVERNYSDKTVLSYNNDLSKFIDYLRICKIENVNDVTKNDIRAFFLSLKDNNLSNRTLGRYYSSLNSFFKYLLEHEVILNNPLELIDYPKYTKKVPEFVYESKIDNLLNTSITDNIQFDARNRLIVYLLLDSGIRLSELVNIKVNDIDFNDRSIKVFGKGSKERYVFFTSKTLEKMKEWIIFRNELAICDNLLINYKGEKLSPRSVERIIKKIGEVNDLDLHPHMLRHTFATDLLNKGADIRMIQELLGHENLDTTQIYTHISDAHIKEVYEYSHEKAKK